MGKRTNKSGKRTGSRLAYAFWAGILAGIPLALIYYYAIRPMESAGWRWIATFMAVFLTGWIGSLVARAITHYGKFKPTGQFVISNLISDALYTTIIWSGFLGLLVDTQPLPQLVVIYAVIRTLLFFMSDYFADKMSFGG
jgi:hypothetical protein